MTKFIAQLLLTVLITFGAAAGLDAAIKAKVKGTLDQTKAFAQEVAHVVFETAGNTELNFETSTDADVKAESSINAEKAVEADVDSSVSAESDLKAEVESGKTILELDHELESDLDFDLNLGN